jgi:glycosyltransferase involved in cell wall biosynthesis
MIARVCLPFYRHAYTVGPALAKLFEDKYRLPFAVVRNVPLPAPALARIEKKEKIILYQGALNEGRGIETALEAMRHLEGFQLWLAGEGDLSDQLRVYARTLGVWDKVRFLGFISPSELDQITAQAWLGLNLFENRGLNYYLSLANKFFSYVQLGVPSLNMDFPEYRAHCAVYRVGLLLPELAPEALVKAVQALERNPELYHTLQENCRKAAEVWNWEVEKKELLRVWKVVFAN